MNKYYFLTTTFHYDAAGQYVGKDIMVAHYGNQLKIVLIFFLLIIATCYVFKKWLK
jgi:hypothetical protein